MNDKKITIIEEGTVIPMELPEFKKYSHQAFLKSIRLMLRSSQDDKWVFDTLMNMFGYEGEALEIDEINELIEEAKKGMES